MLTRAVTALSLFVLIAGMAYSAPAADPPKSKPRKAGTPAGATKADEAKDKATKADLKPAVPSVDPSQPPAAKWVWGPDPASDNQSVYFRASFDSGLADGQAPKSAALFAACDNELEVLLNGQRVGRSSAWEHPIIEDVTKMVRPGRNAIAIPAKNLEGAAAFILKLELVRPDGSKVYLVTDEKWRATPYVDGSWWDTNYDDSTWKPARVVANYGAAPWGKLPKDTAEAGKPGEATPAEGITALPGFKVERLYSVPKETEGSWVSMCVDPGGRLVVCDQYGGLFRVTPPAVGNPAEQTKVEKLDLPIGMAQGLLFAFDSLYVVVNDTKGVANRGSGLYRLPYDDRADTFGEPQLLSPFPNRNGNGLAAGEHGPHAVVLGPDKKSLYVSAGNFTGLPKNLSPHSPVRNYAEDLLLPRNPDGGGHDPTIWSPGGWVCRTDPEGKTWEQVVTGMRNTYDFDFNADGELFAYDSDMEWDTGTPWYRPTRVLLGASAAEFGWRNGTGKWPDFYPDSLPAVVNTGLGSPTGVVFGYGARFPAKYQNALYCVDWAYGKVYAVHLTPEGAGYRGTFETFVEGKAFDGTDVVIGKDGAMYMAIGGRRTQSGLYRITYTGSEPTDPARPEGTAQAEEARAARRRLEAFHGRQDPQAVAVAWPHLNSPDRYLRYAARVAIEWQDPASWQEKALTEKRPTALINALVALCRTANPARPATPGQPPSYAHDGDPALRRKVLSALGTLNLKNLSEEQRLEALRAYGLCFIRLGHPDEQAAAEVSARLDPLYPSPSFNVNREVSQLLAYCNAPSVVPKSMQLLTSARTQEEQLHYVLVLRMASRGWDPELRRAYFSWINFAEANYRGGASFKRFLQRIREDAIKTLSEQEKTSLAAVLKGEETGQSVKETAPRQFVRNWQMPDLLPVIDHATRGRNFANGKAAFDAVGCATCHRFAGDGGATGPDLTGVGNRFSPADVLESILLPSKVVSDQYQATEVRTKDGDVLVGQVETETPDAIRIRTNPYAMDTVEVPRNNIEVRRPSRLSLMPEGLVDVLKQEEILDLIAYLRSGGNSQDKAFSR